jgi:hypothetical protein
MDPLHWLRELHLIADEHDIARRRAHGDQIAKGDPPPKTPRRGVIVAIEIAARDVIVPNHYQSL